MIRLGSVDDVPMLEGRSIAVGGRRIAVFRTAGGFRALEGACPHRSGPLSDGIVTDGCVTCPLHGWRFDLRTGAELDGRARVRAHEVVERDGELFLAA